MSTLAYWDQRGFVQPLRLLLEYAGEEYTDKIYECGKAPEFSRECWYSEKFTLGLDFPNLPYYMDDKVKITQSTTILKYLARKYRLEGSTDEEKLRVDIVYDEMLDQREALVNLIYNPLSVYEKSKVDYPSVWTPRIKAVDSYLGDRQWFAGNKLTYVDFMAYETLAQHRLLELDSNMFENTPNLDAFAKRFEALPGVKEYLNSGRFKVQPLYNKIAAVLNKRS